MLAESSNTAGVQLAQGDLPPLLSGLLAKKGLLGFLWNH